ncbi:MAG TPA: MBL fold metallo-hydrolase [Solirubrobacteraceae bacterium]|nr:MBL fold metallo-hydrolase [Solirubrobacteraceae bacterium]
MIAITWVGHATVLIELDGVRLLTDPVVRARVGPLRRIAPPVDLVALRALDGVLLSHLHADHVDLASLRDVARDVPVFVPAPAAQWLMQRGLHGAQDLSPGADVAVQAVRISAVPAAHDARRGPLGPAADPIGYVVSGSRSTYFAGDTDLFDGMAQLRGRVDIALLPVAGWGPRLGPGHLNPERAARAAAIIAPAVAIPIHWGTLAPAWTRRPEDPEAPVRAFLSCMAELAPDVAVRVLAPGERVDLSAA